MILKEEPKLLYYQECIKYDPQLKTKKGELITSEEIMDSKYYKILGTLRRAFIEDMQEKLDIAMQYNNMKRFAESKSKIVIIETPIPNKEYIVETMNSFIKRKLNSLKKYVSVTKKEAPNYKKEWEHNL